MVSYYTALHIEHKAKVLLITAKTEDRRTLHLPRRDRDRPFAHGHVSLMIPIP